MKPTSLNPTFVNQTSSRTRSPWAKRLFATAALLAVAASFIQPASAQDAGATPGRRGGPPTGEAGAMGAIGMAPVAAAMGGMAGMGGGHGFMAGHHAERLLDSVGASAEQKTQLRQIHDSARADMKPLREAARGLHKQMQGVLTQPNVDARAVETLRQQLLANHEQVSKRMTQALLDASRVLSPEQRRQLAERMEQRRGMMQRHRSERESLEGGGPGAAGAPRRP